MIKNIDSEENTSWVLTPAELRADKKFESLSDDEAKHIIDSFVRLAIIAYNA